MCDKTNDARYCHLYATNVDPESREDFYRRTYGRSPHSVQESHSNTTRSLSETPAVHNRSENLESNKAQQVAPELNSQKFKKTFLPLNDSTVQVKIEEIEGNEIAEIEPKEIGRKNRRSRLGVRALEHARNFALEAETRKAQGMLSMPVFGIIAAVYR